MRKKRVIVFSFLLVLALAIAACNGGAVDMEPEAAEPEAPAAEPMEETAEVSAVDTAFEPPEITVPAGTTVVWTNEGSLPHTVTADDGSFDSGTLDSGNTFEHTFDAAGEYPYYCEFHGGPGGEGMAGTVIVE